MYILSSDLMVPCKLQKMWNQSLNQKYIEMILILSPCAIVLVSMEASSFQLI